MLEFVPLGHVFFEFWLELHVVFEGHQQLGQAIPQSVDGFELNVFSPRLVHLEL